MKLTFLVVAVVLFLGGCRMNEGQKNVAFLAGREVAQMPVDQRPGHWGSSLELTGVPNFARVTDDLYRGDEPSVNGMKNLSRIGVRTIVCIRALHSTQPRTAGLGLRYEQIKMWAWIPKDEYVIQFLQIMKEPANRPVFIHCYTGGDRAGLYVAVYRVVFCGWTKEEAKREMLYGGYGFHEILVKYLVPYFDALDIERMKREAGVTQEHITQADRRGAMPEALRIIQEWPADKRPPLEAGVVPTPKPAPAKTPATRQPPPPDAKLD